MPEFKFVAMKNVDESVVQVVMYEGKQECGTLILTNEGWAAFQEQVLRTKVKTEG